MKLSILLIHNIHQFGGVIGAFNCQGAGWDPKEQRIKGYSQCYNPMSGWVHVNDIEWDQREEAAHMGKAEEYVVYLDQAQELHLMTQKSDAIPITIQPSTFEIFSFVPIRKLGSSIKFAPVGLTNMFNSGGTIQELEYKDCGAEFNVKMKVKGGGNLLCFSSGSPKACYLNGVDVHFEWSDDGKLSLILPGFEEVVGGISDVVYVF